MSQEMEVVRNEWGKWGNIETHESGGSPEAMVRMCCTQCDRVQIREPMVGSMVAVMR